MEASIAEPAVINRIGHTFDELTDDILTEPLPKEIGKLLICGPQPNILCAFVDALVHHEGYQFVERNGEFFIYHHSDQY
jgi:hypothetical protein